MHGRTRGRRCAATVAAAFVPLPPHGGPAHVPQPVIDSGMFGKG